MTSAARTTLSRRRFVQGASAAIAAVGVGSAFAVAPASAAGSLPAAVPGLRQAAGTSLVFADVFEPKTYGDASGGVYAIREGMAQGLVQIDFNSKFVPALATEWAPVDPTTWRFTLRQGVTFHNGVAMDAGAVVFNLQRLAESKDAVAAFKGAAIAAVDSSTVSIKTAKPTPYMPAILADGKAVIYEPSAAYASDGSLITPIGTGPFKLVDWRIGDRRVLEAHSGFWGGAPSIGDVQYLAVPQAQTRANMLRTGAADIARVIDPADVAALKSNSGVQVLTTGLPRVRLLWPNVQSGVTSDARVRRALAHAVDRQTIVETVLENLGTAQTQIFRPDYPWGNPSLKGLPFDQAAARALLAEAGYTTSNPLTFTLTTYTTRSELSGLAQVLQQQWAEVGVQCNLNVVADDVVMSTQALRGELDMTLVARNPLFLFDPQANFEQDYTTGGSYNLSRFTGLDDQIAEAGTIVDDSQRYARYRQMEQQIVEQDVATIVLNSYLQIDATRTNISGYQPHPTDAIALHNGITKS
ncbi:MAG: ABC transporter substrate-binding protein [Chloroflexota bacterium]